MSLVAYTASSSDEDSNSEEEEADTIKVELLKPAKKSTENKPLPKSEQNHESNFPPTNTNITSNLKTSSRLMLPKPRNITQEENVQEEELDDQLAPAFSKLPMPKAVSTPQAVIEEEDDEFLHKKAFPIADEDVDKKKRKAPVRITVPSLKDFKDVEQDIATKTKITPVSAISKGSGLLSILPTAKSEQNFVKNPTISMPDELQMDKTSDTFEQPKRVNVLKSKPLIPDTVRTRRPATNTEGVDGIKLFTTKKTVSSPANKPAVVVNKSGNDERSDEDEDEDDNTDGDFFSLKTDEKLPEVSNNEINAMVAKRAAKIAESTKKFLNSELSNPSSNDQMEFEHQHAEKRLHAEEQLDEKTIQALEGSMAKRRRKQKAGIKIIDISSEQVLPDREEWMRTALASSTTYQPTGVLVDTEEVAGTRKKHQITYLAHKAKANEAELQAIWAANRHVRQQSQNKYGF